MRNRRFSIAAVVLPATFALSGCVGPPEQGAAGDRRSVTLLNVSYDPTREFYQEYNEAFRRHWLETTGAPANRHER
jgi:ABC-type sulfate transport system substrate-binding protein